MKKQNKKTKDKKTKNTNKKNLTVTNHGDVVVIRNRSTVAFRLWSESRKLTSPLLPAHSITTRTKAKKNPVQTMSPMRFLRASRLWLAPQRTLLLKLHPIIQYPIPPVSLQI